MKLNIFLDDERTPTYIEKELGIFFPNNWKIVRNYTDFKNIIDENIYDVELISFDHDIASFIDGVEYTGKTAVDYLINKCIDNNIELPNWYIHTNNPSGELNIMSSLKTYYKYFKNIELNTNNYTKGYINGKLI